MVRIPTSRVLWLGVDFIVILYLLSSIMPKNWVNISKPISPVAESISDPETRYRTAKHESGHAVVSEALNPGSVRAMAIGKGGGATQMDSPANHKDISNLTPDDLQNLTAISLAGGLSEPGGTTPIHSSGDRDFRNHITGARASSPMSNIRRIITGGAGPNDPMLQAPQLQAEGQARANLVLSDPRGQQQINDLTSQLSTKNRLYGDEIRKVTGQ